MTLPGPPFGEAGSLHEAKGRFKVARENFKAKHTAEELGKAFAEMTTPTGLAVFCAQCVSASYVISHEFKRPAGSGPACPATRPP